MEDQKKKLIDLVDSKKDEIIKMCQKLVRTPSVTGNEKDVAEIVASKLREIGLEVELHEAEKDRPNVVGTIKFGDGGPVILLNDHLDVVPPGPEEEWDDDPFGAVIKDGKIYGRGTTDTKGGVTTMLMALDCLLSSQPSLKGEIIVSGTVDEEVGSAKGMIHLIDSGVIKKADMGIVFEPTTMRLEIANRGVYWAKIMTFGKTAH
jgi:acetylornithine deacetylase/succinyl-diaminopimelate desuccinylase-like protein